MTRDGASPHRRERLNAQIKQELATAIARDVKDPRLELVSVVSVDCAADLSEAKVKVSALGDEAQRLQALRTLRHMSGFLRHLLGERLDHLRRVPRLDISLDESAAYAVRVSSILRDLGPELARQDPSDE